MHGPKALQREISRLKRLYVHQGLELTAIKDALTQTL